MSECLITNINTASKKRGKSKFKSFTSCNNAITQSLIGVFKVNASKIKQLSRPKLKIGSTAGFRSSAQLDINLSAFKNFFDQTATVLFPSLPIGGGLVWSSPTARNVTLKIPDFPRAKINGHVTLSGVIKSRASSVSFFENKYTDKFAGQTQSISSIKNFSCAQKLYPTKDLINQGFIDKNYASQDLFNRIDEGIVLNNYNENLNTGFRISDDNISYIQPSSISNVGSFRYQCEVNRPLYHPQYSFLFLRVAAPIIGNKTNPNPDYILHNLILEDPSGNIIVKYKDIVVRGDSQYNRNKDNYVTYISEPEINNANLFTWEQGYPILNEASGYKLNIDCDIICKSTPFAEGFNLGYQEESCASDVLIDGPNNYLALDGSPLSTHTQIVKAAETLRISAIEICNSGVLGVRSDNYVPIYIEVSEIGQRLKRVIRPVELFSYDYNPDIYPSLSSIWQSSPDYDENIYQNINKQNSKILLDQINNKDEVQFITLIDSTPTSDSGRLTLKFSHEQPETKAQLRGGTFTASFSSQEKFRYKDRVTGEVFLFDKIGRYETVYGEMIFDGKERKYDIANYTPVTPVDNYFVVDTIELRIYAKKAPNTNSFALDVVGYSDDKLLNVTPKVGAFLQNSNIGQGTVPTVSGFDQTNELAISSEAISDKRGFYERYLTSIDAGDHYKLSLLPVIDSTEFKEYTIPLQIYEDRVDVGKSTDYSMSSYFENLYIDLYPIPQNASIRSVELIVHYAPANAFNLFTLGRPHLKQLDRKTIDLFPLGWNKQADIVLNSNVEDSPLSLIENIPQAYKDHTTLKTNYSRRWRGVDGNVLFGPYDFSEFDFSFYNPQADHPFLNGFFDFNLMKDSYVLSNNNYLSDLYTPDDPNLSILPQFSGYYNGQAQLIKNIGLRFSDQQLFQHNTQYTSIDWTQPSDSLYGKICDAFDCALRVSGEFGNINFGNVPIHSGFALYFRFTPDYNMSGVGYNLYNSGVLLSKYDNGKDAELIIGFEDGKITAILNDSVNGFVKLQDNQNYDEYQYPLSVVVTHEGSGKPARLYCNNELLDNAYLKDEIESVVLTHGDSDLVCGYSSGSGVGSNIFIHEIGISTSGNLTNSIVDFSSKKTTVTSFLNGQTNSFVKGNNTLITYNSETLETQNGDQLAVNYNKFKLHEFIDDDTNSWRIGAFKICQFSVAYDGLTKRIGKDYLVHYLNHNGSGYDQILDHTSIQKINASGLAYHSQIENDFLRFNLTDIPDANPNFYAIPPRISKTIPRGYKFDERALVVDTIIEHQTNKNILWKDGDIGPGAKLIVSLYSRNQDPIYRPSKTNFGLINRSIHYLKANDCYEKISSTFNHNDLLDISEPWALFDSENVLMEFKEKLYSKDIDDMFLQYDLVYPCSTFDIGTADGKTLISSNNSLFSTHQCGSPFESKIKIHSVNVRLENALTYWANANDSMSLYTSGEAIRFDDINLFVNGHEVVFDSGFYLYTSGSAWPKESGQLSIILASGISGIQSNSINLFVNQRGVFNVPQSFSQMFGSTPDEIMFGSSDQIIYLPISISGGSPRLDESIPLFMSDNTSDITYSDQVSLFTNGATFGRILQSEAMNLVMRNSYSILDTNRSGVMSLYVHNSDMFTNQVNNQIPLYINTDANIIGMSGVCSLFTTNFGTAGTRGFFSWDRKNFGTAIDPILDSGVPLLDANDEIRGVELICFGDCEDNNSRRCVETPIVLHDLNWYADSVCVSGGIFRPKGVYTNLSTRGFNTDIGYSGHFYGIRKYDNLLPNSPYIVTIKAQTGSDSSIYLPSEYLELDYGTNDFVNYSGVKLAADKNISSDERQPGNQYGKSVAVVDDVIAIGAPKQTLEYVEGDETYTLENAGAIFIYRRDPRPEGYSWPIEQHKSDWKLETKLTLPSGLFKDYNTTRTVYVSGNALAELTYFEYPITVADWEVGGEGRQLGYSLDLAINEDMKSFEENRREILVTGGPYAAWNREFEEENPLEISIGLIVFTDEFQPEFPCGMFCVKSYWTIIRAIQDRDWIFRFFSNPATKFNVKIIICEPRGPSDIRPVGTFPAPQPNFISNFIIPRNSGIVSSPENQSAVNVFNGIKSAFETVFPYDETKPNNNIPVMLGIFVDDSMSLGEIAVEPGLTNFINYYQAYSFASGLKNFYNVPASGAVYKIVEETEEWIDASIMILNDLLDTGRLKNSNEIELFTSGVGPQFFNQNLSQFNIPPYSGGKVYIFEKESGSWNLIQEIKSPVLSYETDRFGHAVAISKDTNIIGIGSPYINECCQIWQYKPEAKRAVFSGIRHWLDIKISKTKGLVSRYSQLINQWDKWLETYGQHEANEILYSNLTQTEKFELRRDLGINEYEKIFTYSYGNIPHIGGSWSWIAEEFAPTSRLGYSVAINEDGNIVAFGAPTDSFNVFDDKNVYFTGDTASWQRTSLDYDLSPYDASIGLPGSVQPSWQNHVNAGAIRLFEARDYYPHNSVVEYGKFGNLQQSLSGPENEKYFNYVSGVFRDKNFRKMSEDEVEIPKDAGLAFIITPGVDAISDEVVDSIISWLALGDRNLVLVGNDPIWEDNGAYAQSNRIINDLLGRLNSRMRIHPARSIDEALIKPSSIALPSYQPQKGIGSYVEAYPLQTLYGVGDIRMHLPDFGTQKMICRPSDPDNEFINPRDINEKCELPIMHNGDLRAEWNDICIVNDRVVFYKVNWPFELNGRRVPCPSEGEPEKPLLANGDVVPLLAAALAKEITFVEEAIPPSFIDVPITEMVNFEEDPVGTFITDQLASAPSFIWDSGRQDYVEYRPNIFSMPNRSSPWFVPRIFENRQAVLQARATTTRETFSGKQNIQDHGVMCIEESVGDESKIIAIAGVEYESEEVLRSFSDTNIAFYANMVAKNRRGESSIAQIGGWTGRSSFIDAYSRSILTDIFTTRNNSVTENLIVDENFQVSEFNLYDVFWIANPIGLPNQQEINKLKQWLNSGNKKLIITHDNTITQLLRMKDILSLLGSKIEPLYLPVKEEFPSINYGYMSNNLLINELHPISKGFGTNPSITSIWDMGSFLSFKDKPELTKIAYTDSPIFDNTIITDVFFRLNPGVDKVSFPAIAGSGYRIYFNYVSENSSEINDIDVHISNISIDPLEPYPTGLFSLDVDLSETVADNPVYKFGNLSPAVTINHTLKLTRPANQNTIETKFIDVQVQNGASSIDLYFSSIDGRIEPSTFIPKTPRILSISGVAMPVRNIIRTGSFERIIGYEKVKVYDGSPRLEYTRNISGIIMSLNDRYCGCGVSNDIDSFGFGPDSNCDQIDPVCIEERYHNQLIADGPIVAAQELEMITNFPAGVARSRITVLSDSNLIQGIYMADQFNRVPVETDRFIASLYPITQFPTNIVGKQYTKLTKIVAPERGSAHKYKALKNQSNISVSFGPLTGSNSLSSFNDIDSLYDPGFIERPKREAWPDRATPEIIEQFKSGIRETFYSTEIQQYGGATKFSGIIDGKLYVDVGIGGGIPQIMKDTGYDYLDFDNFEPAYPGDLFGYSIAINKNRIIVGAPFAAFSDTSINNWSYYRNTGGTSGIELSRTGGAGAVYIYEKNFKGIGPRGVTQPWQFIQKLRPESINVGQDLEDETLSQPYNKLGPNSYSENFLIEHSVITDQFGYDVDIDSDIIIVGSPGHDFDKNIVDTSGEFIRKEFNREFTIPDRIIVELGNSGVRENLQSGVAVLNNGAIFTFENAIDDWTQRTKKWSFVEKIIPQGPNSRAQNANENDFFGRSVSIHRAKRSDSDYVIVGGSENNSYSSSGTDFVEKAGAAYTNDIMLRQPPPVLPDPNTYIDYKVFGSKLYDEYILRNIVNNIEPNKEFITSGIIYTNDKGSIFLEASGQDTIPKGFIQHRPYIASIEGIYFNGMEFTENLPIYIGGRYDDIIQNMPLFVTATTGNVYNTLGLYTNSVVDFGSGILNLNINKDLITVSDSGIFLYVSGIGNNSDNLNLRIRGY